MVNRIALALVFSSFFLSSVAHAEEPPTPPAPTAASPAAPAATPPATPTIHHAPRSTAQINEDVQVGAVIDHADRVKRALLVYKSESATGEVEFQRSSDTQLPYVAVIPATAVRSPILAYAIEIETTDGARLPVFATRAQPHPVTVLDAPEDARESALLTRLGGRRSVVHAGGDFVSFGTSSGDVRLADGTTERRNVKDQYYRVEGSYTYRLLGTVSEFGLRAGVIRGTSLVPNEIDRNKYDVGLNYGAPRIRLRVDNWFHVEGEALISVTEVGFSMGGGGALILGDPYGSKLTIGGEGIEVFGARGYTRLDVVASKFFSVAPIIEVTSMPHAEHAGVRLLGETGFHLGAGFRLDLRGGYQARSFERGGPSLGGGLAYAF
jgi:hypothetical protein